MASTESPEPGTTAGRGDARVPLAAAAIGVYALLVSGATAAIGDAAGACSTWPACPAIGADPQLLIAWGHRLLTLAVGGVLLWAAWRTWRAAPAKRVWAATGLAVLLYPVQVGIGAVAAGGVDGAVSGLHLAVGATLFTSLVAALGWSLDPRDALTGDAAADGATDAGKPSGGESAPTADRPGSIGRRLRAYLHLTKPRLMWLLCLVALAAMALTPGAIPVDVAGRTLLGGVLAIGASGTFNHVLERDRDRKMRRTDDRPLPTDCIPVRNAVAFGILLAAGALALFASINPLTAVLGLTAILFYSVIYTLLLKPNTVQNTVLGGAAGALPALIGWAAVTDGIGLPAVVLAAVIFCWTPAHFYNLAMAYREDYARGGFPMLPVVRGGAVARRHVVYYLGATLLASVLLTTVAGLGPLYAAATVLGGTAFLASVVALDRQRTRRAAMRAFHASNAFLGLALVAVVIDGLFT